MAEANPPGMSRPGDDWVRVVVAEKFPGEEVLWVGRPRPLGYALRDWFPWVAGGFLTLLLGTLLGLFVWFIWIRPALGLAPGAPVAIQVVFPVLMLPMLGVGLWLLHAGWRRYRTAPDVRFVLTGVRALVLERRGGGVEVWDYPRTQWNNCRIQRWRRNVRFHLSSHPRHIGGKPAMVRVYGHFQAVDEFEDLVRVVNAGFSEFGDR